MEKENPLDRIYEEMQEQGRINYAHVLRLIKKGKQHIIDLYNRMQGAPEKGVLAGISDPDILKESYKALKRFGITDKELESELAKMLIYSARFIKEDKKKIVSIYIFDLIGEFVLNPEKDDDLKDRMCEYASFRASADYITAFFGMYSRPELILARAEADVLGKKFRRPAKPLTTDGLLSNARTEYEHAAATAEKILREDFFRLAEDEQNKWEKRARLDEKIAENYPECLEILRTARYRFAS